MPPPATLPAAAQTLVEALRFFEQEPITTLRRAWDLGCGWGPDTLELLRRGWHVTAVDRNPDAVAAVRQAAQDANLLQLSVREDCFETLVVQPCELINATFALPFCAPAQFAPLWQRLTAALNSGGRFAGQFFGPHDTWAADPALTIFSRSQVEALLAADYEVELLKEQEKDGTAYDGRPKHWHVLHVVARRRA